MPLLDRPGRLLLLPWFGLLLCLLVLEAWKSALQSLKHIHHANLARYRVHTVPPQSPQGIQAGALWAAERSGQASMAPQDMRTAHLFMHAWHKK